MRLPWALVHERSALENLFLFVRPQCPDRRITRKPLKPLSMRPRFKYLVIGFAVILLGAAGAAIWTVKQLERKNVANRCNEPATSTHLDSRAIALFPEKGSEPIDGEIRRLQDKARSKPLDLKAMIRLGWAFVKKARLSCDPGYYKLAEQAAESVQSRYENDPDALLLRGHVAESLHRFKEAAPIAQQLVSVRGESTDYALLGDALMEQGSLGPAIDAYQKMVDLRPDLQAYTRIAHIRWLTGDLDGALEIMQMAVTGASVLDAESSAWAFTRVGIYQFQKGQFDAASESAATALEYAHFYPGALLLRGKILLARDKISEALEPLTQAAAQTRLPEYQWILADAQREAGDAQAASETESGLIQSGAANDPRTFALYLASRGRQLDEALQLATAELSTRRDVLTMDAVAWALYAKGRYHEAASYSQKALLSSTRDARLFYHAGCIAIKDGRRPDAKKLFRSIIEIRQMLFPSERADFDQKFAAIQATEPSDSAVSSN
jgi:tetratricopeptide (TPR) repeat protein